MPSKSTSFAKALILLSVAIGLTSAWLGKDWHAQAAALRSPVSKLKAEERQLTESVEVLRAELPEGDTGSAEPAALEKAVSDAVLYLLNSRVAHGVSVPALSAAKAGGSTGDLVRMAEAVPGTRVQSVRINLSGTYSSYEGLRSYLEGIQETGVPSALVAFAVTGNRFDASVRVFGSGGPEFPTALRPSTLGR